MIRRQTSRTTWAAGGGYTRVSCMYAQENTKWRLLALDMGTCSSRMAACISRGTQMFKTFRNMQEQAQQVARVHPVL
eukprot:scaffold35303_cov16-Tisochrysis_lutea.AAC.2